MEKTNKVFIATSMDGFIADKNGGIEWLDSIPEINEVDSGYASFSAGIDAMVMGRATFETVCGFDIEWPYQKPVFIASNSLTKVPEQYKGKAFVLHGTISEILFKIHQKGYHSLYIDGGRLIQSFLKEDVIDEMIITIIPILLGDGHPLFGDLQAPLMFECKKTTLYVDAIVQNHYVRKR